MSATDTALEEDESEVLSPRARAANHKEIHYHSNGSNRIVWAWACGTTGILVAIIGTVALYFASQQADTNQRVADALVQLAIKVGQLETKIDNLEDE